LIRVNAARPNIESPPEKFASQVDSRKSRYRG
jgi:hypothetical protein